MKESAKGEGNMFLFNVSNGQSANKHADERGTYPRNQARSLLLVLPHSSVQRAPSLTLGFFKTSRCGVLWATS
jgi:hypothetical protein